MQNITTGIRKMIKEKKIKEYYLRIAKAVSTRSPCLREHYGAVIVKNDRIVSVGYNAPATGEKHCSDCSRKTKLHGSSYSQECPAIHAEENAVINAGRDRCIDGTLYLWGTRTSKPCYRCDRVIKNAGIKEVIINEEI